VKLLPSSRDSIRLRDALRHLLDNFEMRVREASNMDSLLKMCVPLKDKIAHRVMLNFFGEGSFKMFGVDGSKVQEERLEMLLFYICAAGFYGNLEIDEKKVIIDISHAEWDEPLHISTTIPLWLEDVSNLNDSMEYSGSELELNRSIESIPYALMCMAELKLAYDVMVRNDVKVVFLDRLISGTYGPLARDFRLLLKRGYSAICNMETPYGDLSMLDLRLAGYLGSGDIHIPFRGPYAIYALIRALIREVTGGNNPLNLRELPEMLGLNPNKLKNIFKRLIKLNKHHNNALFNLNGNLLEFNEDMINYWRRAWFAADKIIRRIFGEFEDHPLMLNGQWITVLDLNTVNLLLLYKLVSTAVNRGKLLIGIVKDTGATDMIRACIPILKKIRGNMEMAIPKFRSDRALLSLISASNYEKLPTPWRSIEYDACLSTIIGRINDTITLEAARKIISREKFIVKGYFQLRSVKSDPSMRSAVFAYDRPYYEKFDSKMLKTLRCVEMGGEVEFKIPFEVEDESWIGNMALKILSQSDNPNIIEEMGHNHLLFLADKLVKLMVKQGREMIRGIADLDLMSTAHKYRAFFSARRFRDIRSEAEHIREVKAREM